jgi:hypothetical protein
MCGAHDDPPACVEFATSNPVQVDQEAFRIIVSRGQVPFSIADSTPRLVANTVGAQPAGRLLHAFNVHLGMVVISCYHSVPVGAIPGNDIANLKAFVTHKSLSFYSHDES